jgi:hypothetical protein
MILAKNVEMKKGKSKSWKKGNSGSSKTSYVPLLNSPSAFPP